jgi:hypothetical protein
MRAMGTGGAGGRAVWHLEARLRARTAGLDPTQSDLNDLFARADADRSGTLDFSVRHGRAGGRASEAGLHPFVLTARGFGSQEFQTYYLKQFRTQLEVRVCVWRLRPGCCLCVCPCLPDGGSALIPINCARPLRSTTRTETAGSPSREWRRAPRACAS